jgi:glucokinase
MLSSSKIWAIGIDIGGTKIEVGRVDDKGKLYERILMPTEKNDYEGTEKKIAEAAKKLIDNSNGSQPVGFGIGVAGQIERKTGIVKNAPNLNWIDAPLLYNLQESLQLPGIITNDVRAAAWGEWVFGAGKNCRDLVCLYVGTGVGGGVVSGGRMLTGNNNTAGELGHLTINLNGSLCTCGNKGCLEAYAGGWAIAKRTREIMEVNSRAGEVIRKKVKGNLSSITAKVVLEAYKEKDRLAREIVNEAIEALVAGGVSIVNAFNPSRIILGGGIINAMPEFVGRIEEGIKKRALSVAVKKLSIVQAKLGAHSGVIGAATVAFHVYSRKFKNVPSLELID